MFELLTQKISTQQAGKENTPAYMVGEQLKDICRQNQSYTEIVLRDLDIKEMSITAAAEKIKAYADKNKGSSTCFCVTPIVAENIIREFYGLPKADDTQTSEKNQPSGFVDLDDFL